MRCPKCRRTLEPGTMICPKCNKPVIVSESGDGTDRLNPQSAVSLKGVGSRMSGTHHVRATRHRIAGSDDFDSSPKTRCLRCGAVIDVDSRKCRKCGSRIT